MCTVSFFFFLWWVYLSQTNGMQETISDAPSLLWVWYSWEGSTWGKPLLNFICRIHFYRPWVYRKNLGQASFHKFSFTTIFSYLAISSILSYSRMTGIGRWQEEFWSQAQPLPKSLHIFAPQFPHFSKWTKQCRSPQEDRTRKCAFSESFQGFLNYCHY